MSYLMSSRDANTKFLVLEKMAIVDYSLENFEGTREVANSDCTDTYGTKFKAKLS